MDPKCMFDNYLEKFSATYACLNVNLYQHLFAVALPRSWKVSHQSYFAEKAFNQRTC